MNIFVKLLLFCVLLFIPQKQYPLKYGKPTSKGIDDYIKTNQYKFVDEYQAFIKDSLYNDVFFSTEDFRKRTDYDTLTLGITEMHRNYSCEIFIDNEPKFTGYDLNQLTKWEKNFLNEYDQFVKATIFHELTHIYILQCFLIMHMKNMYIDQEYDREAILIYPNYEMKFGSEFIQEGICEYLIRKKGEIIPYEKNYIPETKEEIIDRKNIFKVQYQYSSYYLKHFLDSAGLKNGIFILFANKPPTYEEILKPNLFFNRLK